MHLNVMDFDIAVIGGGVAGVSAAIRTAERGKKVLLIEKEEIGGECINRACIPSKTLIDAVRIIERSRTSPWLKGQIALDYQRLMKHKDESISAVRSNLMENLKKLDVHIVKGSSTVNRMNEVNVNGKTYTYDKLVIATGSEPVSLKDFPLNGKNVVDAWTAMNLNSIPKKVIIVGGGVAGVELATLFNAVGSSITILELMPQLLPGFDRDVAEVTRKRLEEKGIRVFLNAKSKIDSTDPTVKFSVEVNGKSETVQGDIAVITIGRKAVVSGIDTSALGVELDQRGYVKVDGKARTTNPNVYSAGDVAGVPLSATKAWRQGLVAGDNAAGVESTMPKYIPASIFADLEIGVVGKTPDELRKANMNFSEVRVDMKDLPRAWTVNETSGFLKVLISDNGKIEGAHMIGEGATEVITQIYAIMEAGVSVNSLYSLTEPHPTISEAVSEAIQRYLVGRIY